MFGSLIIWTVVILLHTTDGPDKDAATTKDLEQLQGTWHIARVELPDGSPPIPESILKNHRLIIRKNTWTIKDVEGITGETKPFSIDPTKTPKWIDLTVIVKFGKSGGIKERQEPMVINGIYEINGDTLRMCHWSPLLSATFPPERPKEMKATTDVFVFVWERVKEK